MLEALNLIRTLGLRKVLRLAPRYRKAIDVVRGYVTFCSFSSLLNAGFVDEAMTSGSVDVDAYARAHDIDPSVLLPLCEYLDGVGVMRIDGGRCRLLGAGRALAEEPRGSLLLAYAYTPLFHGLSDMLHKRLTYGENLTRLETFVAEGSGLLCEQLPYPLLTRLIQKRGIKKVLDLGCGDLTFLMYLYRNARVRGCGIDISPTVIEQAKLRLSREGADGQIDIVLCDMFCIDELASRYTDIDAITSVDVFHEYTNDGPEKIVGFLRQTRRAFPHAYLIVAECCKETLEHARGSSSSFLEHNLYHSLSKQRLLSEQGWEKVFADGGYVVEEKQVYQIVGHGYFVLKPGKE